ncbi:helix-turn-helix transcriptional regulator [Mycolicibacterium elephantis]|uniref:helix-turn-helix transcriptional regulator n=1 Tax=Mycolicibacterium elephantis TaxID=81858 RepID=UPI000FE1B987|nr:LuxR family transcriptional regulator [Mycolicibacterium elephantis]MCV7224024.1 AAA family ATPase [Mycolicibacterium elephantis]
MTSGVIERPAEHRVVSEFLRTAEMRPSALVLEGEAGAGKTTIWLAGVDDARARGFQVLWARVGPQETTLSYAAVADLLSEVEPAVVDALPDVQRHAVDHVLLRASGTGPATDQSVIAAALGSVIEHLSRDAPVLVAIDDVQWLDPSSRAVLASSVRQFSGPVGMLLTERTEHDGTASTAEWLALPAPDGIVRHHVGPLSLGALRALLTARLGRSIPRPTLVRIAEISGGNPFYALELAGAIESGSSLSTLPPTLAELMRMRIGRLDDEAHELLLAAASAAAPTVELLEKVTRTDPERLRELLEEATARGILKVDGDAVQFTHQLLARTVYTDASRRARRVMHRRLAEVATLPEARARHMALAASSADAATLEALDEAAEAARARGAPAAAAELIELAIGLGGDTPIRRIRAAEHYLHAGDLARAQSLLDKLMARNPVGTDRAMALNLLAAMRIHHSRFDDAVDLLEQALQTADCSPDVRVRTLLLLSHARLNAGDLALALQNAERAVTHAADVDDPDLTSQALSLRTTIACMCGRGVDKPSLRRALALERPDSEAPIAFRASANNALLLAWTGQLDAASDELAALHQRCVERGAETDRTFIAVVIALTEVWRGRYDEAARVAEETVQRAQQLGGDQLCVVAKAVQSVVTAYTGEVTETRETACAAIDLAHQCGAPGLADWASISLGFLEVSLGNYPEATRVLRPLMDRFPSAPGTEIINVAYVPDAVRALIALDRHAEAEPMIDTLEANGRLLDRPWMLAVGARGRSLLLAARGDLDAAVCKAEEALTHHDRLPMPFERARTLLLLSQLQRRRRRKDVARAKATEALKTFESLGAPLWVERARTELARDSVPTRGDSGLTPSERRVAELAASGLTTREVATALFISPKTVEANLARIYRKLGINTRAELGRVFSQGGR